MVYRPQGYLILHLYLFLREVLEEKKQMLALREEKKEEMMRYVRGLDSTEQVPIGYAV